MATLFNNIEHPGGRPVGGIAVSISLTWDTSVSPMVKNSDDDTVVVGLYKTETDADGRWEIENITPNSLLLPESYYKIEEVGESTTTYYVEVLDNATPTFWVGDLTVATPSWEA